MKKLAICIPNYNRPQKLKRLLAALAEQITIQNLGEEVEICVSDDCSAEKPDAVIEGVQISYPDVSINLHTNEKNMGMDYNFLQCVMMSQSEYCWIIGNDDMPEEGALKEILGYLDDSRIDMLVCPFDIYDWNDNVQASVEPLYSDTEETLYFDTGKAQDYHKLIGLVRDGNAIFCFLSNVVFRKRNWIMNKDLFQDKMNTIFIQMYMNLKTLKDGAIYVYTPYKFIKNYEDKVTNSTLKREYDVLIGLSGVIDYFFSGTEHDEMRKRIVDPRINGRMWELPDEIKAKQNILQIESPKIDLYRDFFVPSKEREDFFNNKFVLLYGAGNLGQIAAKELNGYHLIGLEVFDIDERKWGKLLEGYEIEPVKKLFPKYFSKESIVVVANANSLVEIVDMLQNNKVNNIAIIT